MMESVCKNLVKDYCIQVNSQNINMNISAEFIPMNISIRMLPLLNNSFPQSTARNIKISYFSKPRREVKGERK